MIHLTKRIADMTTIITAAASNKITVTMAATTETPPLSVLNNRKTCNILLTRNNIITPIANIHIIV